MFATLLRQAKKEQAELSKPNPVKFFTVWSLDVWGNDKDGYQVNDRCRVGEIEIDTRLTDTEILTYLKREGWLNKSVNNRYLEVDWIDSTLEFYVQTSRGKYLYQFEAENDRWEAHIAFYKEYRRRNAGKGFGKKK